MHSKNNEDMRFKSPVTFLIANALQLSLALNHELQTNWIRISSKLGAILPASTLTISIQRVGRLDSLLRSIEEECAQVGLENEQHALSAEAYAMLTEVWIGSAYEIFRIAKEQRHMPDTDLPEIVRCLELIRVPLEKHQIARDWSLKEPLQMEKRPSSGEDRDFVEYDSKNAQRSHIMPTEISARGSMMWHVIDVIQQRAYWIERQEISDRILRLWPRPD